MAAAPLSPPSLARLGERATVAPRGRLQLIPKATIGFPAEVCESERGEMEKRSRQRVRDQVARLAFGAETRMRSSARGLSMMAKEHKRSFGPDTEAQDQSSPDRHFRLATRGRSIQMGHEPIFIVSVRCGASGCCGPDRGSLRSDAGGSTALVPCSQAIGAGCGSLLRERTVEPDRSNSYHLTAL